MKNPEAKSGGWEAKKCIRASLLDVIHPFTFRLFRGVSSYDLFPHRFLFKFATYASPASHKSIPLCVYVVLLGALL